MASLQIRAEHDHRVNYEGQKLLRLVGKAFYDHQTCIVLAGLLHLSPNGERVSEPILGEEVHMSVKVIHEVLARLELDLGFALKKHSEEIQNEDEKEKVNQPTHGSRSYTRVKRMITYWEISYERLVDSIKFRREVILKELSKQVDTIFFCPSTSCPNYMKPVTFGEAVQTRSLRKAQQGRGQFSSTWTTSAGLTLQDGFYCAVPACEAALVEKVDEVNRLDDLKKRFNSRMVAINAQTDLLEKLLRERRDLRAEAQRSGEDVMLAERQEKERKQAELEAARNAEITEEERRLRALRQNEFLLQDDATEQERLERQRLIEKEQARELEKEKSEEKKRTLEEQHAAYLREMAEAEERRRQRELDAQLVAQATVHSHTQVVPGVKVEVVKSEYGVKLEPSLAGGDVAGGGGADEAGLDASLWGAWAAGGNLEGAEGTGGDADEVMVAGVPKKVSELTQDDIDMMTSEEHEAYSARFNEAW